MIRNLKSLGVIVAAVFAMSAIGASAASAAEFHAGSSSGFITGTQISGAGGHVFTTSAGTVTCSVAHFEGTFTSSTATSQTITPKYEKCTAFGFINVPIHINGCDYNFTAATGGQVHIICAAGKAIEITTPGCTTTVGTQTVEKNEFTNSTDTTTGKMHVILHTTVSGIVYNECGTVRNNGTYKGTTTITATDTAKVPTDITWT
jgi:hypothetical protein